MSHKLPLMGGLALLLAGVAAIAVYRDREDAATRAPAGHRELHPAPDDLGDFVGSSACAACHTEIARAYARHPMAHSLSSAWDRSVMTGDDAPVASFSVAPWTYRIERRGDSVMHRELLVDGRGQTVTEQAAEVMYAIGSGIRGKSYVIDRGGLFFQSPISWYAQPQKWDLSPGFSTSRYTRFERRVGDDCLACHAGRVHSAARDRADTFADPPFFEMAIGCERCHGPGRRHIERMKATGAAPHGEDLAIINPARLANRGRDSVCFQCHLSANRVLRYGRRHDDFRPGQNLEDILAILVEEDDLGATPPDKAVSHVQQMCASRCFRQSGGALTCTTCHDPHRVPTAETKAEFYRKRCLTCHQAGGCLVAEDERRRMSADDSCLDCHMPKRDAADIAHTTQTDHRIVRTPSPAGPAGARRRPRPPVFFDGSDERMPVWEARRALGLGLFNVAYRQHDPTLLAEAQGVLVEADGLHPNDPDVLYSLATIAYTTGDYRTARPYLEQAIRIDPRNENSLKLMGLVCFRTGDYDSSAKYFRRLLALNPWNAEAEANCTKIQAAFSDLPGAIRSAERALELAPAMTRLRSDLVKLCAAAGDTQRSRAHHELLEQIEALLDE